VRIGRLSVGVDPRTQASSHNSQGVVDGGIDKAGMNTVALDRSAVFSG